MRLSVYWDSTESEIARLLLLDGEQEIFWPSKLLPEGSKEGDWLLFNIFSDQSKKELELAEIEKLRQELLESKHEGYNE